MSERRLSEEWTELQEEGKISGRGVGKSAERAVRDERRKRPRMPTEDRRVGRKIAPTLSTALVRRLRAICQREGYINNDGEGIIASPVIEDLLWVGVEAYERGELVPEDVVTVVKRRLRRKPAE
jgi:hypothetical protein